MPVAGLLFVIFHFFQPRLAGWDIGLTAEFGPNRTPRQGLCFLQEGETPGVIAFGFGRAELRGGFEQGEEQGFLRGTDADDPCGHAIDAGVEVVEADAGASEEIAADQFFHDGPRLVVEDDDMIAVPTDAAADVQEQARDEEEDGRNFVGEGFRRMKVPGIEAHGFLPRDRVGEIKFVRAGGVALGADAEKFAFDRIDFVLRGELFRKDGVERICQALAGAEAINRQVLVAIGDPHIGHTGGAEGAADVGPDAAAAAGVFDPEIADALVAVGEGEAVRGLGVGEASRVEIHARQSDLAQ